jgi:hypothetical protein
MKVRLEKGYRKEEEEGGVFASEKKKRVHLFLQFYMLNPWICPMPAPTPYPLPMTRSSEP